MNKATRKPGEMFINHVGELYTARKLSPSEHDTFWHEQLDLVYGCTNWDDFLAAFSKYAS